LLCRAVLEEAQKEADKILDSARNEADRILREAEERTNKEVQTEVLLAKSKAQAESKQIVDLAELEARKRLLSFQQQVTHHLLESLEARLKDLRNEHRYADFLLFVLREGINNLPGASFIVEVNEKDVERIRGSVDELAEELSAKITLIASPSVEQGCRTLTEDRRLLYDNTLASRLKRFKDDIQREIWRMIFAGGQN
jgi:V/A-type H+-transporting ATPase subunit E